MEKLKKIKSFKVSSPLLISVLKGSIIAVAFSLVLILLFAVIIKLASLSDSIIMPVNQVLKIISIFFGCYFALKHTQSKGLLTGALIGIVYTVLAFLVFSALGKSFNISLSLLNDMVFSLIIGGLSGVFLVNKKMKNR